MEKVELKQLKVADLVRAPWEPRGEEEFALDNPAMVELVESVRVFGVTQSLAVWERGKDEPMLVIAGCRRLEAAKAAELRSVPAIVYSGITEARAREITRTENEIRRGIDPLRDAEQIEAMLSKGLNQKEIASHFAVSEATICRRTKLLGLIPEVRDLVAGNNRITTEALEQIALYPEETQRECLGAIKRAAGRTDATVKWSELKWSFDQQTKDLDGAKFNTDACRACPFRTGAQPDLWHDIPADGKLGSCVKCECYAQKMREYLAGLVTDEVGKGVKLVDADAAGFDQYDLQNRKEFSTRKSKKCPVAWWFWEAYSDKLVVLWGPSLEDFQEVMKAEEEAAAAEEAKKANESEAEKAARAERDAELKRIAEEREALRRAVDEAAEIVADHVSGMKDDKLAKAVKSGVVGSSFKGAAVGLLTEIVVGWFRDYSTDNADSIRLLDAFPAFAKAVKVKPAELKAYHAAVKALAKFDAEHED